MKRYKLTVEYIGKNFSGWQRRPEIQRMDPNIKS